MLYPSEAIPGYSRDEFLADLTDEAEVDIRGSLDAGAASVQIDFTEARLSLKLDPSGGLLRSFVALNNQVLDRFTARSASGSASMFVPVAITTPRIVRMSTTQDCFLTYSN